MWPESEERNPGQTLRTGLTTGSCATACCVAAAHSLLKQSQPASVTITLPKGRQVELKIENYRHHNQTAITRTIKDAGDDPDATHGATVFVELTLLTEPGIIFKAAKGVGTVTRNGLLLDVGEPAINPVPRKMMTDHLQSLADFYQYPGGFEVAVGVEDGEQIAQKTMNPRLGIIGGLSILGTTGIVRPFSCSAWIASIHQGIDVANANGITHIAATTGNSSENAIREHYQLPDVALIEMGDFAGAVLKHIKALAPSSGIQKLTICGGVGKMTKLANGHLDLNSRVSAIDFEQMAALAQSLGANDALVKNIQQANTSIDVLNQCRDQRIDLAGAICENARMVARRYVPEQMELEVWAINRQGQFIGSAQAANPSGASL